MIKKVVIALGALATTASLLVAAPAQARPHEVCHKVWVHGHPHQSCHHVR
jgi:hypothetical protein